MHLDLRKEATDTSAIIRRCFISIYPTECLDTHRLDGPRAASKRIWQRVTGMFRLLCTAILCVFFSVQFTRYILYWTRPRHGYHQT